MKPLESILYLFSNAKRFPIKLQCSYTNKTGKISTARLFQTSLQHLPRFSYAPQSIILKSCWISQKRSGIRWCQDSYLGEPEKIYNIFLDFHVRLKIFLIKSCCISQKRSGIRWCQDSYLGEPEKIYNICLDFRVRLKIFWIKSCCSEALRQAYGDAKTPT